MTNLTGLIQRTPIPLPWAEGDNIPWHDPEFSQRMLREHLSQSHDAASRRLEKINRQVAWIHEHLLNRQPTRILDLGCGPGLYSERLARLGHTCVGIDYSPASIEYAVRVAQQEHLSCRYFCEDLRQAEYGSGFGLAMQIYGEINVFRPADARLILTQACEALDAGGWLLLEPHTFDVVHQIGQEPATWYTSQGGLFSSQPHLMLQENLWDAEHRTATMRHFVVDASTGRVTRYAQSLQAYTEDEYRLLLDECGFGEAQFYPSLGDVQTDDTSGLFALVARKRV